MNDLPPHTYFLGLVFVGWVVLALLFYFASDSPIPRRIRPFLAIPCLFVLAMFFADFSIEWRKVEARSEVRDMIRSVTSDDYTATVNGILIAAPSPIAQALLEMGGVDANHAWPRRDKRLSLALNSAHQQVVLSLVQDSRDEHEYWVFSSQHSASYESRHAVSRIRINDLDFLAEHRPRLAQ